MPDPISLTLLNGHCSYCGGRHDIQVIDWYGFRVTTCPLAEVGRSLIYNSSRHPILIDKDIIIKSVEDKHG